MIIQPILRGDNLEYILRNRTRVLAIDPLAQIPSHTCIYLETERKRGNNRTKDLLPRTRPPPPPSKQRNRRPHHTRIIHILRRHRSNRREQEHHTNKEDPGNRNPIQRLAHPAKHVRAGTEIDLGAVDVAGEDHGDVGEVERGGGDVEDCYYSLGAADADAV